MGVEDAVMSGDTRAFWPDKGKVIIGMIHLLPLPGAPRYGGDVSAVREAAMRDAEALAAGGVHGLMIENFGDVPFYPGRVPAHVVAEMTAIAVEVRRRFNVPLGINVLRNDGQSALAVAHAAGAQFIRVNILCGARVADQGIIQGIAHDLLRDRAVLQAERIGIFADVDVKHSAALAPRSLEDDVHDTIERGLADALIVSGAGTGKPTDPAHVTAARSAAGKTPVFIGSGVTEATLATLLQHADGAIIGTAFKQGGLATNPVDPDRVRKLMQAAAPLTAGA
jgi:membrane complex biogenesis BtpA family protein